MYVIVLSCVALILQFLPSLATVSSLATMTREEGEDVVFMYNTSTNIPQVSWGIQAGDTNSFKLVLIAVNTFAGVHLTQNAGYAGRVSFVGDLSKGQAWFKITNLNIKDTNQYMARIILQGESKLYRYSATRLTVIQRVPPSSTKEGISASSSSKNSPQPTTSRMLRANTSFPTKQSSSTCTCTSIIAACVTIITFLILVVVVLLIYIWRLKLNTGRGTESRMSSSIPDKELEAYENDHPMVDTSEAITTRKTRTQQAEKQLYETINENRDKGTAANVKPTRDPSVGAQGADEPSLPQHYQELQRMTPNPTPLYEPLKHRDFGKKGEQTSEVPKTYEKLHQSGSGREYQSLTSYKADTESKV